MKLSFLKSYLVGAGSTLEMFPNSDPDDDLVRICQRADRWGQLPVSDPDFTVVTYCREGVDAVASDVVMAEVKQHLESYLRSDRDALAEDWRSIGGDFLAAYEKSKKLLPKPRKNKTECWGS
ncbi:hypothetical protein DN826_06470 [Stutzerimonas nosocomialis]|uniref:hypothetical protein n=1 Tax=Stutzerimonas nosocomialis TaxID=1056496 RepID=UPI001108A1D6|nr:hypothetical protein [Stutzerimonas nosocomialis]TLX57874.1 hypothetical protein DN826_06470 [Stutzerimonas nosocomialis]